MADPTYQLVTLMSGKEGICCRQCGMTSWNPNDVEHKFCAKCHQFHRLEDTPTDTLERTFTPGYQTRWLAEMGSATLVRVLRQRWPEIVAFPIEPTLEYLPVDAQAAWLAAAAAIRRRVVQWGLSAEEEGEPHAE